MLLIAAAWLPPVLLPLRAGSVGLASFDETMQLTLALAGVVLPLLGLLAGADLLAGEMAAGTLVPVVTLPISRAACFAGKCLGRGGLLVISYLIAFGSAAIGIAAVKGTEGLGNYLAIAGMGLLLSFACGGIGVLLGTSERGRVRVFGSALGIWVVFVFALDAVLLAAIVAFAPAPPQVGHHGHSELSASQSDMPTHEHHTNPAEFSTKALSAWLLVLDPVDLFRMGALVASPNLRTQLAMMLPGIDSMNLWLPLALGWLFWLAIPPMVGLWRFQRASLR